MPRPALIDTTIRDGNQSLWASRMTTRMLAPALSLMDSVGYKSIEMMSSVDVKVMVEKLGENPWDRVRFIKSKVLRTPLRMIGINQAFLMSGVLPEDARRLITKTFAAAGIDEFWITASMNDVRTAEVGISAARAVGARQVDGGIQFTVSPVHSDDFFANVATEFVELGVDAIILKDASGLLTPVRAKTLIPKLLNAAVGKPVYVHSHCTSGLGPGSNLEAAVAGASAIWTCTDALANGLSLPSDQTMTEYLEWAEMAPEVDREAMVRISDHFGRMARRHRLPLGRPAEYDPRLYEHQMPGGMVNHFRSQLQEIGMVNKLPEVLKEMPAVRKDLGWPNVQTPYAQFIGAQALLNVLHGRYAIIPNEVRRYVLGYYGRTPAPVDPNLVDRVLDGMKSPDEGPNAATEQILPRIRETVGPSVSDEDLVLATLFMPTALAKFRRGGPYAGPRISNLVESVAEAITSAERAGLRSLRISGG